MTGDSARDTLPEGEALMPDTTTPAADRLHRLRQFTTVVADTGDLQSIRRYRPADATTNPSLILKAAGSTHAEPLLTDAIAYGRARGGSERSRCDAALTRLAVNFGCAILELIPGRVSTEVDARLSFDAGASAAKARELIRLYEERGVGRERVLIKLAATWEGIRAAQELERDGIHCNMTLMFALCQAAASAGAGATLISPFVGRITDWYKKARGVDTFPAAEDPGVRSVRQIYNYCKKFGFATQVMGASFRNVGQVLELAGCDLLTISPELLETLRDSDGAVTRKLEPATAADAETGRLELDEAAFRWHLNEDPMATEKLAEGIRRFARDAIELERLLLERGL